MAFKRNWLGQKRIVCDGCGISSALWKAVGWTARDDNRQTLETFHPNCPERRGGCFKPLAVLR